MTTAYGQPNENKDDYFVLEINRVKDLVRTRFKELREILTETENGLLKELDDILTSYASFQTEVKRMNEQKRDIEGILNAQMSVAPTCPIFVTYHENMVQDLTQRLDQLQTPVKPKLVTFVCEKQNLLTELNKLCKLVERDSEIDYTNKSKPIISACDRGTGNDQLYWPHGVKLDHNTGNIFVADCYNDCVKVFNSTAEFLFKFGDVKGEGKITGPRDVLIHGTKVLASHNHCIQVYQLDGKFVSSIGGLGSGELQFQNPWGLSTSNNDVYICDTDNNRIEILTEDLQYKSQFGQDTLRYPRDIKLFKDNIFILDKSNPCLHIYNRDLVLQKNVVTRGSGQQIINPYFFFIDEFGYILITDYGSNSIHILNSEFETVHKIFLTQPTGITMDNEERIIVVCNSDNKCLQIT